MFTRCKLLVPLGHGCKRCKKHPGLRDTALGAQARVEPALADDPVDGTVWKEVVRQALPVLRTLPLGSQDPFFTQLALELDLLDSSAGDTQVYACQPFAVSCCSLWGEGGAGTVAKW